MRTAIAVILSLLIFSTTLYPQEQESVSFSIANVGKLQIPKPMKSISSIKVDGISKTAEFQSALPRFTMMITIIPNSNNANIDSLKQIVENRLISIILSCEENNPSILPLDGNQTKGWYYSLTDMAPKQGEFKYLTQGGALLGKGIISFTILSDEKNGVSVDECLKSIKKMIISDDINIPHDAISDNNNAIHESQASKAKHISIQLPFKEKKSSYLIYSIPSELAPTSTVIPEANFNSLKISSAMLNGTLLSSRAIYNNGGKDTQAMIDLMATMAFASRQKTDLTKSSNKCLSFLSKDQFSTILLGEYKSDSKSKFKYFAMFVRHLKQCSQISTIEFSAPDEKQLKILSDILCSATFN